MNDVARHTYTSRGASKRSRVDGFVLIFLRDIMEERSIEQELGVPKCHSKELLDSVAKN